MTEHIHTCNYTCKNPACIKVQRDELVKLFIDSKKEWKNLTDLDIEKLNVPDVRFQTVREFVKTIEAAIKEKNK